MRATIGSERLVALTDGVVAVILTIMVLELKPPHGADVASLRGSKARSCGRTSTCCSGSR